jgi:dipeptidyl aminopeptidase/acylaminoacyl peptidase
MTRDLVLEDFYELTLTTDLALSPDGERVAFVTTESDPDEDERRSSLFVVPADGNDEPYRLTRTSGASSPKWSPDGTRLGFIATREQDTALRVGPSDDEDENENNSEEESTEDADTDNDNDNDRGNKNDEPKPQVWVFDLARGGDAQQVTNREEGVREYDWGPDGKRLVIGARDPTEEERADLEQRREDGPIEIERLQHKANGVGWLDSVRTYLFVVDLETREETRLDDAYGAGAYEPLMGLQPAWGPDRIAFLSNRTERPDDSGVYDVFTISPDGSDLQQLTDSELRAVAPRWSPDGERLTFSGGHPTNWYRPTEVYVAHPADGTYTSVSPNLDRTLAWNGGPEWIDSETIFAVIGDEAKSRLVRCHADGSPPERVFEEQGEYRTITGFSATEHDISLIQTAPDAAPDVFTMSSDLDDPEPTRVTDLNAEFEEDRALPQCERLRFENSDSESIEALAFLPEEFDRDDPASHPLIVSIHGGPMSYDTPSFNFSRTYWTNQGYVVLCVNYRGSTSYGRTFSEQLHGTRGELESDDIISGVEHLIERGWADPDRLFVTGFSYGGITSAHVVARTDLFTAAAPEHGIYDWFSMFGTDDNHIWAEEEFGLPWENVDTYRDISSITRVGEMDTPLLITAGEKDWRCPPTQAEQLYVSVKKRGVPAKLVIYQNEHHNIGEPERAIHRLRTIEQWFEKHDPTVESDESETDNE